MGATLYEMLAGHPPFIADDPVAVLAQHMTREAPSLRDETEEVPAELDALIRSMMAKDPAQRPRDMEAIAGRLAAFV
jgi:serine/threonine-protein kinase